MNIKITCSTLQTVAGTTAFSLSPGFKAYA